MSQQHTIKKAVGYSGLGLHSGNRVHLALLPAPPNSGIRFRRIDLEGRPEVEARAENVVDSRRSTTIGRGSVKVQTVEHVLAALAAAGVSNAVVELDANEPPIADGSARDFARLVQEGELVAQPETAEPIRLAQPIELVNGETHMAAFPHCGFKISCTSADRRGQYTQFYSLEITPESFAKELADARTFCFFEEIEQLIRTGLIKGGSLENAVVIRDDAVLTTEPLRFPDEFVRHKILDIVGDLALIGKPLCAHIIAIKPSHSANTELARAILAQVRKPLEAAQTFAPPPAPPVERTDAPRPQARVIHPHATVTPVVDGATLDITGVLRILPHRPPFLMVDNVLKIDGNKIVAKKNLTIGEPYFDGHFPGHPIMPGVLQLEAIAQVAGILMMRQAENAGKLAYFMSAEDVKWRKPVRPGDSLIISVEMTKSRGKIGKARGVCTVEGEVVSEAHVTFMLVDREA